MSNHPGTDVDPTSHEAKGSHRWSIILFDLDGTVWDSERGIIDCLIATFEEMGVPALSREEFGRHLGPPLEEMLVECGIARTDAVTAREIYRRHYRSHGEAACAVYPGVESMLASLRSAGLSLATATSKGWEPTERMLEAFGLSDHFSVVGAASMDASRHHKVDVIAHALDLLGSPDPEQIVMIGDRHYDIGGGQRFGMDTVGVEWGYAAPGELDAAKPTHLVANVDELVDLLLE